MLNLNLLLPSIILSIKASKLQLKSIRQNTYFLPENDFSLVLQYCSICISLIYFTLKHHILQWKNNISLIPNVLCNLQNLQYFWWLLTVTHVGTTDLLCFIWYNYKDHFFYWNHICVDMKMTIYLLSKKLNMIYITGCVLVKHSSCSCKFNMTTADWYEYRREKTRGGALGRVQNLRRQYC